MPPVPPAFQEPDDAKAANRWHDLRVAALCIAVGAYTKLPKLSNPVRDAQVGKLWEYHACLHRIGQHVAAA